MKALCIVCLLALSACAPRGPKITNQIQGWHMTAAKGESISISGVGEFHVVLPQSSQLPAIVSSVASAGAAMYQAAKHADAVSTVANSGDSAVDIIEAVTE